MGERGLVAERSQRPALRGFDAHGIDLDSAERVVDDLRIRCGGNGAVRANSDGQDGRNSDAHLRGRRIAADRTVSGGREGDTGSAGAARSVNSVGSGSGNGKGCEHTNCENEGNDLLSVLHSKISL